MKRRRVSERAAVPCRTHRNRLRALMAGFVVLALAYGARLVQLQVLEADRWRQVAAEQHASHTEIPASRGSVLDRHGRPLAADGHQFDAYLAPRELTNLGQAAATVAGILGLARSEERRLTERRSGWVKIRRVSSSERERLIEALPRGLHFEVRPSRVYPEGALARSLLGALDEEGHGLSGLELELDSLLRGLPGAALARKDALGNTYRIPGGELSAARPGHELVLTIDAELQAIAENALTEGLNSTGASGGDVLMLDPWSGELLAVASHREGGFQRVFAFTDPYEPGSTLKPFLLAALLAEGAARLDETVDVEGGEYAVGRRVIRDVYPNDSLSVAEVVSHSSNIGAAKLAERLSPGAQYRYLRDFGFGMPTGLAHPAESGGRLRRPQQWSALSQASLAMGYEIAVTSLQQVVAFGALANGGVLMRPRLVREIRDPDGRAVYTHRPEPVRRVVSPEVARAVTSVLVDVVKQGTGTRAALARLAVAGKTGTARLAVEGRYEPRYTASFVAFAPADEPRLVILVRLDDPQRGRYGGSVAAPVAQAALEAALATRGIVVDRRLTVAPAPASWGAGLGERRETGPFVFAVGTAPSPWPEVEQAGSRARPMPDLRGLPIRSAVRRLLELGFEVELHARGTVKHHRPGPGRPVPPGAVVVLR